MSDTPLLKAIAELSTIKQKELRFINLTGHQCGELLEELDTAFDRILDGEFLGVQIIEDIYEVKS